MNDIEVFETGVKLVSEFGIDDLMPHFIYCGYHYWIDKSFDQLREIFLTKMRKYGIQSAILTMLNMYRWKLVTKEKVKQAYEGKLKSAQDWKGYEKSISDDLETFFESLQHQKEIKNEIIWSFFLPKLTEDELKLVEEKNDLHLGTYRYHYFGRNPDVDVEEMKKSDSKSKYVKGLCRRYTTHLTIETSSESSNETLADNYFSDQSESNPNSSLTDDGEISRNSSKPNEELNFIFQSDFIDMVYHIEHWRWRSLMNEAFAMDWKNGYRLYEPNQTISTVWSWS